MGKRAEWRCHWGCKQRLEPGLKALSRLLQVITGTSRVTSAADRSVSSDHLTPSPFVIVCKYDLSKNIFALFLFIFWNSTSLAKLQLWDLHTLTYSVGARFFPAWCKGGWTVLSSTVVYTDLVQCGSLRKQLNVDSRPDQTQGQFFFRHQTLQVTGKCSEDVNLSRIKFVQCNFRNSLNFFFFF